MKNAIYLDHAATTPVRPEVLDAMRPVMTERFGNPSSVHGFGREARALLENAREQVAAALGAERREIIFTSGGTEADNLAVLGGVRALGSRRTRVIISAVEHKAVIGAAEQASAEGAELVLLGVNEHGVVDLAALEHALPDPRGSVRVHAVCAVMWGNNEVGTLQPVSAIGERCGSAGVSFHSDAVQAFGRVRVRVTDIGCTTLAISGHKIGAPKGVGALFVRQGTALEALMHGGGQERGVRPGTENLASIVGLGVAAELAVREQEGEGTRLEALRDRLEHDVCARLEDVAVNAAGAPRLPHVLNLSFGGVDQEALLISLDLEGLAASSGSACQSGSIDPSHVLTAMGQIRAGESSIRWSLGHTTTTHDIDEAGRRLADVVARLRGQTVPAAGVR